MLRLAWRNVWRNRRRSLITMTSMGFGLAAIMFAQSVIKTLQGQLVEKATGSIAGHIQIQHRSIKEYKFPDKYIDETAAAERALQGHPRVQAFARRITLTGLISSPVASVGVFIVAIEPEKERLITTMEQYLTHGNFLRAPGVSGGAPGERRVPPPQTTGSGLGGSPKGIVVGEKLAQRLDLRMGEKAVIMAQASDGSMGAEAFRLVGLYRSGSESFDGQIAYVPLPAMQELLAVGPRINHWVARLRNVEEADRVRQELAEALGNQPLQVLSWKDVDHEIVGIQKFQNGILSVVLVVVFMIVGLGILNTLLMSFFERVREFGVLMAMGARPAWVLRLVLIESVSLGLVATAVGFCAGSAMIAYFGYRGLHLPVGEAFSYFLPFPSTLYLRPAWANHLIATAAVLLTSFISAVPPALRACRLRPAEALRHV